MSREIEFRWWSKRYNRMFNSRQDLYQFVNEKRSEDGYYKKDKYLEKDEWYTTIYEMSLNFSIEETCDCVPIQYIGLKDKNGVKIFEGDIVRISTHDCPEFHGKYEVKYERDRFMLRNHGLTVTPSYPISLEVIGNIYENPELLEVQYESRTN